MCRGDAFRVPGSGFRVGRIGRQLPNSEPGTRNWELILAMLLLVTLTVSCRRAQDMATQPRHEPYEPSAFFTDQMSARPLVAGTVPRGALKEDAFLHTGRVGGALVDSFPFPVTDAVMRRGAERYRIYCTPCHGQTGRGDGMIVRRGYRRPPSFHTADLRNQKIGHFFDVMTNGFGAMPQYGAMIAAEDRWAIAAYIRALQLSQGATVADVPESERAKLDAEPAPAAPAAPPPGTGVSTPDPMQQPVSGTMDPKHAVPAIPDPNAPQKEVPRNR